MLLGYICKPFAFLVSPLQSPATSPTIRVPIKHWEADWMKKSDLAFLQSTQMTRPGQGKTDVTIVIQGVFVCLVQNIRMRNWGTIFSLLCSPFFKRTEPEALCQPLVAGKWYKLSYHTLASSNWRKDDPIWITSCKRKLGAEPANTRQPVGKTAPVFSLFSVGLSGWGSLNTRAANSWITVVLLLKSINIHSLLPRGSEME